VQPIFVGDVQGCADEFDELLERAHAAFSDRFELWLVGDIVNRGPFNLRVLERVRELVERGRAHVVLGNHELSLLRTALGERELSRNDSFGDVLASDAAREWLDWLCHRPLVVTGTLGEQPFAMVHAAVHPDWDRDELVRRASSAEARLCLPDRDACAAFLATPAAGDADRDTLARLTSCRSVTRAGDWSSEPPDTGPQLRAWHVEWSRREHGYGVVYGHWSLQGLHVAPWLRGLDTGCVHHGRGRDGALTAWLPDPGARAPFSLPDTRFWRVPARRAYYARRDAQENSQSRDEPH
jgi:bis(5'-nucleosyl)-tetraphosphatase (symmetrical)